MCVPSVLRLRTVANFAFRDTPQPTPSPVVSGADYPWRLDDAVMLVAYLRATERKDLPITEVLQHPISQPCVN